MTAGALISNHELRLRLSGRGDRAAAWKASRLPPHEQAIYREAVQALRRRARRELGGWMVVTVSTGSGVPIGKLQGQYDSLASARGRATKLLRRRPGEWKVFLCEIHWEVYETDEVIHVTRHPEHTLAWTEPLHDPSDTGSGSAAP